MKRICIVVFFMIFVQSSFLFAQTNLLEKLLGENKPLFQNVIEKLDSFEVQIIYTQIDRSKNNVPKFTTYKFNVDAKNYFYPASTVKLPAAVIALEKLNKLKIKGLDKFTPLRIDSSRAPQSRVVSDSSSSNGLPSIANYIKKVFLVSDNDAYNRLYEFIGQEEINASLHSKGIKDVKIVHRFVSGFSGEDNRYTNAVEFYNGDKTLYRQPMLYNPKTYCLELNKLFKGIGYLDSKDKLVNQPFDFSAKNYISLESLTEVLKRVIFPQSYNAKQRFNLTSDDYKFLHKYMSMYPLESKLPTYDSTYYDSYVKYFMFGDSKAPVKNNIRIFNKVGLAYGYLTDVAYIADFDNNVEFMLSAVIHVNKDGIYNDGIYEYDSIGIPFMANLGRVIYQYELHRERKHIPNLSQFKFIYK